MNTDMRDWREIVWWAVGRSSGMRIWREGVWRAAKFIRVPGMELYEERKYEEREGKIYKVVRVCVGEWRAELVCINILVRGKRPSHNWSFCESTLKSFFSIPTKAIHKECQCWVNFLKKVNLFDKKPVLLKSKIYPILFDFLL